METVSSCNEHKLYIIVSAESNYVVQAFKIPVDAINLVISQKYVAGCWFWSDCNLYSAWKREAPWKGQERLLRGRVLEAALKNLQLKFIVTEVECVVMHTVGASPYVHC